LGVLKALLPWVLVLFTSVVFNVTHVLPLYTFRQLSFTLKISCPCVGDAISLRCTLVKLGGTIPLGFALLAWAKLLCSPIPVCKMNNKKNILFMLFY
jgi:hypothetical protein